MKAKESVPLMGKIVTVHTELRRSERLYHAGEKREWKASKVGPRAGWIIGTRTRQNGTYISGGFDDQSHLNVSGTVPCLLVAYWPTVNPVYVPLDGFTEGGTPEPPRQPEWTEKWKAEQRENMEGMPRDAKGRWVDAQWVNGKWVPVKGS